MRARAVGVATERLLAPLDQHLARPLFTAGDRLTMADFPIGCEITAGPTCRSRAPDRPRWPERLEPA